MTERCMESNSNIHFWKLQLLPLLPVPAGAKLTELLATGF